MTFSSRSSQLRSIMNRSWLGASTWHAWILPPASETSLISATGVILVPSVVNVAVSHELLCPPQDFIRVRPCEEMKRGRNIFGILILSFSQFLWFCFLSARLSHRALFLIFSHSLWRSPFFVVLGLSSVVCFVFPLLCLAHSSSSTLDLVTLWISLSLTDCF